MAVQDNHKLGTLMDHNKYQELNTLSVYEELKSDEQSELIHHLVVCPECYADFEEKRKLKETLSEHGLKQPGVALLNQARRELRIALENDFKKKFITKLVDSLGSFFSGNYKMILAGTAMVLVGLIAGKYIFSSNTFYNCLLYTSYAAD